LDPTIIRSLVNRDTDEVAVITPNVLVDTHISTTTHFHHSPPMLAAIARQMCGTLTPQYLNVLTITTNQAIANTGATSIFIMDGLDMVNKHAARKPLTFNLPDGKLIMSTHICDIIILGLPTVLMGHIVPLLKVVSLIGICLLCKAGCMAIFNNQKCNVIFNVDVILRGYKDPGTDLWMLLLTTKVCTAQDPISCHNQAPIQVMPHTHCRMSPMPIPT
jgi:hypothetical protein